MRAPRSWCVPERRGESSRSPCQAALRPSLSSFSSAPGTNDRVATLGSDSRVRRALVRRVRFRREAAAPACLRRGLVREAERRCGFASRCGAIAPPRMPPLMPDLGPDRSLTSRLSPGGRYLEGLFGHSDRKSSSRMHWGSMLCTGNRKVSPLLCGLGSVGGAPLLAWVPPNLCSAHGTRCCLMILSCAAS